jgi:hypothetical protein
MNIPPDIRVGDIIAEAKKIQQFVEGPRAQTPDSSSSTGGTVIGEATQSKLAHATLDKHKGGNDTEDLLKCLRAIGHLWYWEKVPLLEEILSSDNMKPMLHSVHFFVDEEEEFLRVSTDTGECLLEIFSPEDVAEALGKLGREFFSYVVAGENPGMIYEYRPQSVKKCDFPDNLSAPDVVLISTRFGRVDPNAERSKLKFPGDISEYDHLSKMPKFLLNHKLRQVYEGRRVQPAGMSFHQDSKSLFLTCKGADVVSFSKANASWLAKSDRLKTTFNLDRRKQLAKQVEDSWRNRLFKSGGLDRPPRSPHIEVSYYEILRFVDSGQMPDLGASS